MGNGDRWGGSREVSGSGSDAFDRGGGRQGSDVSSTIDPFEEHIEGETGVEKDSVRVGFQVLCLI